MSYLFRQLPGWAGTIFVGACCLGVGPLLASAAVASGVGFLALIFSIYILGPLVILSVAWVLWNTYQRALALGKTAAGYPALWLTVVGGLAVVAGVFLPPVTGAKAAGATALYVGLVVLIAGSVWSALDRRKNISERAPYASQG